MSFEAPTDAESHGVAFTQDDSVTFAVSRDMRRIMSLRKRSKEATSTDEGGKGEGESEADQETKGT